MRRLVAWSVDYPRRVAALTALVTVGFLTQFPSTVVDTDPENMLEADQPDRAFYQQVKADFGIYDLIVVGVEDDNGIFRPDTLNRLARIADALTAIDGVVADDVLSFSTTDDVTSAGGLLTVDRIMNQPPKTDAEAEVIRQAVFDNPLFTEKLVSSDGRAAALYVPIESKDQSYRISREIEEILQTELDGQRYYIAGLPVAEDTFGVEMFHQMGMMAPLAMGVIFALLLLMFRQPGLIVPPMIIALLSVIWGMGALVGLGFTVHIMSSMIPVFLMPIAVLDSVHVLSEFHDRYPAIRNRRETIIRVMEELYRPMLYTSLTSAAGFASLLLAPIPPVRVFGAFVAFGILVAFLLTVMLVPAGVAFMSEASLQRALTDSRDHRSLLDGLLRKAGQFAVRRSGRIFAIASILLAFGLAGLSRIIVNDNPVKWFKPTHTIRQADDAMNRLFGGTYMANLVILGDRDNRVKDPEVMRFIADLQAHLESNTSVGKTTSIADVVRRVNYVLHDSDHAYDVVPDTTEAIGQELFLFQMSGDPNDLDNFVDYDYSKANIWVQLRAGDNRVVDDVASSVDAFLESHPAPDGLTLRWSGLTYINKVWQDLMVTGMRDALLGGFGTVFVLMVVLFRSFRLATVSMLPLAFAIGLSYGLVGWLGKDYDMPIAVCSSLALGLSIDFAIHFVQRFRRKWNEVPDLKRVIAYMFGEPARAIARNAIVIAAGFLPLAVATLTPYVTVGVFFAILMTVSAVTTLLLLPALMTLAGRWLLGSATA